MVGLLSTSRLAEDEERRSCQKSRATRGSIPAWERRLKTQTHQRDRGVCCKGLDVPKSDQIGLRLEFARFTRVGRLPNATESCACTFVEAPCEGFSDERPKQYDDWESERANDYSDGGAQRRQRSCGEDEVDAVTYHPRTSWTSGGSTMPCSRKTRACG